MATTTIPGLNPQTNTDSADLFVLHNTAENRTRHITYQNLKNELQADINPVTQSQLTDAVNALTAAYQAADLALKQAIFQVGSKLVFDNVTIGNVNPATYLGFGTWVKEEGYYYVGHKSGDADFGTVGALFGSKTHSHGGVTGSTVLTEAQLAAHTHGYTDRYHAENDGTVFGAPNRQFMPFGYNSNAGTNGTDWDNNAWLIYQDTTLSAGQNQGHTHTIPTASNLPPTKVEIVWRRTA